MAKRKKPESPDLEAVFTTAVTAARRNKPIPIQELVAAFEGVNTQTALLALVTAGEKLAAGQKSYPSIH